MSLIVMKSRFLRILVCSCHAQHLRDNCSANGPAQNHRAYASNAVSCHMVVTVPALLSVIALVLGVAAQPTTTADFNATPNATTTTTVVPLLNSTASEEDALSSGTRLGIILGVVFAVLLFVAVAVYVWFATNQDADEIDAAGIMAAAVAAREARRLAASRHPDEVPGFDAIPVQRLVLVGDNFVTDPFVYDSSSGSDDDDGGDGGGEEWRMAGSGAECGLCYEERAPGVQILRHVYEGGVEPAIACRNGMCRACRHSFFKRGNAGLVSRACPWCRARVRIPRWAIASV